MPDDAPVVNGRKFDWVRSTDPRNADHPLRATLPAHVARVQKLWVAPTLRLDQGPDGACVGFGWTNEALTRPASLKLSPNTLAAGNKYGFDVYHRAQQLDEYKDTPPEEGSSVNGGALAMRERKLIQAWAWASSVDDVIDALITTGPVVVGTNWLEKMFNPGEHGILNVSGRVAGGHCYCLTGFAPSYYGSPAVRMRQSWGVSWGLKGAAWIRTADFARLLADGGEAAQVVGKGASV
jgi:hypothetical protein